MSHAPLKVARLTCSLLLRRAQKRAQRFGYSEHLEGESSAADSEGDGARGSEGDTPTGLRRAMSDELDSSELRVKAVAESSSQKPGRGGAERQLRQLPSLAQGRTDEGIDRASSHALKQEMQRSVALVPPADDAADAKAVGEEVRQLRQEVLVLTEVVQGLASSLSQVDTAAHIHSATMGPGGPQP